jgi:GTPase SAR1 family protein
MAFLVRKPLLIGGMGLSLLLLGWQSFHTQILDAGQWLFWGTAGLGFFAWKWKRRSPNQIVSPVVPLTQEIVENAIADSKGMLEHLAAEVPEQDITELSQKLTLLSKEFDRQTLQIGITGGKGTGKSTLSNLLTQKFPEESLSWRETESLLVAENGEKSIADLKDFDITLFLITGDLTNSEWEFLQSLNRSHHRLLLLFNKQDQYLPEERLEIFQKVQQQVSSTLDKSSIFSISVAPKPLKVRKHQADGTIEEYLEETKVNLEPLSQYLFALVNQEKENLILGTIWRQAQQIKQTAKDQLNQSRRDRALPVIEQYQWLSAGTALVNPMASLDLLATAAINGQMVLDLSAIYQQKFSFSQAQTVAVEMGELIVKLGLVELTTQSLGSLLKTNAVTYLAGGAIQGMSAAYLTRVAGLSLIEYFQAQEVSIQANEGLNLERLGQALQQVFGQTQRLNLLQDFAKNAIAYLPNSTKITVETTVV